MSDGAEIIGFPHKYQAQYPCDVEPPCETVPQDPPLSPASQILSKASALIDGERNEQHGDRGVCHRQIARFWSTYLAIEVTAIDVACMMALLKIARTQTGTPNQDCWVDACGYLSIAGELHAKKVC